MNKFKIGDRVITTDGGYSCFVAGNTGTIIDIDGDGDCIVEFDPDQWGVDYTGGIISVGRWYVPRDSLEHIPESQENTPWYETEEGKEWLSKQNSVEEQFMQEKQQGVHKIGNRYVNGDEEYILAQTARLEVCLIELTTDNRWADPVKVIDPFAITEDEWFLICVGDEFVLVE